MGIGKRIIQEKKITFRLDMELVEGLQNFADNERVPLSWVLRHLVIRFLKKSAPVEDAPACAAALPLHRSVYPSWRGISETDTLQAAFRQECCELFDGFIAAGMDIKEATKRTNFALKAKKHPWATFDIVSSTLRKEGRFRKGKR